MKDLSYRFNISQSQLRDCAHQIDVATRSLQAGLAAVEAIPTAELAQALGAIMQPTRQEQPRKLVKKTRFAAKAIHFSPTTPKKTAGRKRKAQQASDDEADDDAQTPLTSTPAASSSSASKRSRLSARKPDDRFSKDDDGFEMYKKRGKQFVLMQMETVERIKAYLKPVLLPEQTGWLIKIIGPIKFTKPLIEYALDQAWDKYDSRIVEGGPRESMYREVQLDGSPAYTFDTETAAASDAFRVITMELLSFLKSCVKSPSSFYAVIHIVKPRRAAFPHVMINSLGEPYKKVFDLALRQMVNSDAVNNVFATMSDFKIKQVLAESLFKERQTRHVGGFYDETD